MRRTLAALLLVALSLPAAAAPMSDAEIRQALIRDSIASYPGPCACPYERARNGSLCGRRSAYSRPGGYAPLCYDRDITPDMVREYRANHGG
jgi:hypothetical protein